MGFLRDFHFTFERFWDIFFLINNFIVSLWVKRKEILLKSQLQKKKKKNDVAY